MDRKFLHSTAILIGTMVGVGIFGLPFAFAKAGFLTGFLFLIITALLTLLIDAMFGEVVLRTSQKHQVVGYASKYLGETWKKITFFAIVLSGYGALLAYIIISGEFLSNIFSSFFFTTPATYSVIFFVIVSLGVALGLKRVAWIEFMMAVFFIFVILLIFIIGIPKVDFANFKTFAPYYWFLPYGILLFAFAGLPGIPIQREVLYGQEHKLKKSITVAVAVVAFLYFIFTFTIVGLTGAATSSDAISGLFEHIGTFMVVISSIFGVMAVGTSYLILGTALYEVFIYDYGLSRKLAWSLTIFPPIILFWSGLRAFINVIGLAGSLAIGLEMVVLTLVFTKAKSKGDRVPEYSLSLPKWLLYGILLFFAVGIVYTFIAI